MKKEFLGLKFAYVGTDYSRTIVVPRVFSLAFLHEVIQASFGWLDYHVHQFIDAKGVRYDRDPEAIEIPLEKGEKVLCTADVKIEAVLKKKGDTLGYIYDFGDYNRIEITNLGPIPGEFPTPSDFASTGPDLVEDSAALGFTPGIVKLLSKKGKPSKKVLDCINWLDAAFGKTPNGVLREPSASEIEARVMHLVGLVLEALPKE